MTDTTTSTKVQDKKTKIVATIGPATESQEQLENLLRAGFNVMRMNFSHGDDSEHQHKIDNLRKAVKKTGIEAALLQDLSGPKFRIGDFYQERVMLKEGDFITLTSEEIVGDEKRVSVNYPTLAEELKPGNMIMIDDGKKKFEVIEINGNEIRCKIIIGGETKGRRSINLPGAYLKISSLTAKDKKDIKFGLKNNVEFIAFSFVRRPEDVTELRSILNRNKSDAKIISKIETQEAVDNFDEILSLSDGIMVARGDLAVEIGTENVPPVQKMMIMKCATAGKPVITATQMLESMIKSPVPTRAEVSDVANAIYDGTDAVMLSEETTLGSYPIEAVNVMTRIALKVESDTIYNERISEFQNKKFSNTASKVANAVTGEVIDIAKSVDAKVIVAVTNSGFTARMISRYKPSQPVVAITPNAHVYRQLLLSFGVQPVLIKKVKMLNEVLAIARQYCVKNKLCVKGDKIIVAVGRPFEKKIDTNMVLIETI